jgi:hypothetical protein
VLITSLVALFLPTIGYYRDGSGFQGILAHPQIMGVFVAPIIVECLINYIIIKRKRNIIFDLIFILSFLFMFLSKARTSLVAVAVTFLLLLMIFPEFFRSFKKYFSRRIYIFLFFILILIFNGLSIEDFIFKGSDTTDIAEAYEKSRGFLLIDSWLTFLEHPWFGIGFGVSLLDYFAPVYDAVLGIPISAPTEKSLLPVVVLEELGIFGFFSFIVFLKYVFEKTYTFKNIGVLICVLALNIGEATIFSMAAMGLFQWLIIGAMFNQNKTEFF